ncbi:MAG TPA: porin [Thermoanaerobaculia bacterium]|nr:porin [Thermoanaerobaculia bacterium]
MSKSPRLGALVLVVLSVALLAPAVASAQAVIKVNDNVKFQFGMQIQAWADWLQDQGSGSAAKPFDGGGFAQNLFIRRARFLVSGQMAPNLTFFFQTDAPNLGKTPKALTSGFVVQDAYFEWKLANEFMIDGGLFLTAFTRNELTSTTKFISIDVAATGAVFSGPTASSATRDTGFGFKGYLIDGGRLEYRANIFQGVRAAATSTTPASHNSFRTNLYMQYNFLEKETGYVYAGTYLGTKKVAGVSAAYDGQSEYNAYAASAYCALPLAGGDEFALQSHWAHYNGQKFIVLPQQNDYFIEAGYYMKSAKVQPYGKFESQHFTYAAGDQTRYSLGMNYYVSGYNLKITGQFTRVETGTKSTSPTATTQGGHPTSEFTVQLQAFYF